MACGKTWRKWKKHSFWQRWCLKHLMFQHVHVLIQWWCHPADLFIYIFIFIFIFWCQQRISPSIFSQMWKHQLSCGCEFFLTHLKLRKLWRHRWNVGWLYPHLPWVLHVQNDHLSARSSTLTARERQALAYPSHGKLRITWCLHWLHSKPSSSRANVDCSPPQMNWGWFCPTSAPSALDPNNHCMNCSFIVNAVRRARLAKVEDASNLPSSFVGSGSAKLRPSQFRAPLNKTPTVDTLGHTLSIGFAETKALLNHLQPASNTLPL